MTKKTQGRDLKTGAPIDIEILDFCGAVNVLTFAHRMKRMRGDWIRCEQLAVTNCYKIDPKTNRWRWFPNEIMRRNMRDIRGDFFKTLDLSRPYKLLLRRDIRLSDNPNGGPDPTITSDGPTWTTQMSWKERDELLKGKWV